MNSLCTISLKCWNDRSGRLFRYGLRNTPPAATEVLVGDYRLSERRHVSMLFDPNICILSFKTLFTLVEIT